MTTRLTYSPDGLTLLRSVVYDPDAKTVTTDEQGVVTVEVMDADMVAALLAKRAARQRRDRLDTASATLRQWATDARATNVGPMTVTQHKQVTQTVVDRLGVFFDRFADLLDER